MRWNDLELLLLVVVVAASLQTTTTTTSLSASWIWWNWSDIFNAANFHVGTSQSAKSWLSTWAWGLGAVATSGTQFDVQSSNSKSLAFLSDILKRGNNNKNVNDWRWQLAMYKLCSNTHLGGQHSGVGRGFITISLDLHASGNARDGFFAGQVRHMDESIVEAGIDVSNSEDDLSFTNLWAKRNLDFFFDNFVLARSHVSLVWVYSAIAERKITIDYLF